MNNTDCEVMSESNLTMRMYTDLESTVTSIVMPVVLVFGISVNLCFIFIVYRVPDMRITINVYLVSLAVADICFLVASIVDKLIRYSTSPIYGDAGHRGTGGCILSYFFINITLMSSELHMLVLAVERYYSVCVPFVAHINPRKRAIRLVTVTWLVSASIAISFTPAFAKFKLYCLLSNDDTFPETYGACLSITYNNHIDIPNIYFNFTQTFVFLTTILVSNVLYVKVLRHLQRVSASLENHESATQTKKYRKEQSMKKHFNRMLCLNWLIYFSLSVPFHMYSLYDFVSYLSGDAVTVSHVLLLTICRLLIYLNSCINPLVYGLTNPRYRNAFLTAFSTNQPTKRRNMETSQNNPTPLTEHNQGININSRFFAL